MPYRPSPILCAVVVLSGCLQKLPVPPEPAAPGSDAGQDPPVVALHWLANGPEGDVEEGPVRYALGCADAEGNEADCALRCSFDGAEEEACAGALELSWVESGPLGEPQDHELCVRVSPPGVSAFGEPTCRGFRALPYHDAYRFRGVPPGSRSRELDVALACERPGDGDVLTTCTFGCSLDGRPFVPCAGRFRATELASGEHVLRIETRGPERTLERRFARVTVLRFHIDTDATPELPESDLWPWPRRKPRLTREELAQHGLDGLLDPYADHALACAGDDGLDRDDMLGWLASYFTQTLASGHATLQSDRIEGCRAALALRNRPCPGLPGWGPSHMGDGFLPVRLPDACRSLFAGSRAAGATCVSSAVCLSGLCEWDWLSPSAEGVCAVEPVETHEGIMCAARGCSEGLYCTGPACARTLAPGSACDPSFEHADCGSGQLCSGGATPRCATATDAP